MSNLSSILKAETDQAHQSAASLVPFFAKDFTRDQYARLLSRLLPFFEAYEAALHDWRSLEIPHFSERTSRARALRRDVEFFQVTPSHPLPPLKFESREEVLGTMYVVEGSTLGGVVIAKHLAEQLNLTTDGLQFYLGYGERTMPMWMEFKTYLDTHEVTSACIEQAKKTFALMGAVLRS